MLTKKEAQRICDLLDEIFCDRIVSPPWTKKERTAYNKIMSILKKGGAK